MRSFKDQLEPIIPMQLSNSHNVFTIYIVLVELGQIRYFQMSKTNFRSMTHTVVISMQLI